MSYTKDYFIGADVGNTSVGYAVTDANGELLKQKKQNMMGVSLFEEAQSAKDTRVARCTRRRYDRRKNRLALLQDFLEQDINKVDDCFYLRLKQSSLWSDDKDESISDIYTLFNDKSFDEKQYYKKFPTIYHLRKHLMLSNEKEDIRLVYLALHNIVKYRGNFLYEDVPNVSAKNSQLLPAAEALPESLNIIFGTEVSAETASAIAEALSVPHTTKRDKQEAVEKLLSENLDKKISKNIAYAMIGYKADFNKIFSIESEENLSVSLSDETADDKVLPNLDDYQTELYEILKKIYSSFVLSEILSGKNVTCISDAMIGKYNDHKNDLKVLKRLIKEYFPKSYNTLFRGKKVDGKYVKGGEPSYTKYILSSKDCPREILCGEIKKLLESKKDELENNVDYIYCMDRINADAFLGKINSTDNGTIPFQLHLEELSEIIEKQGKFYPNLLNEKDKICSLVSFRIPYYVGPLNEKRNPNASQRQFAWMERKKDGEKIYPWNFEEVVDVDKSAENFIRRMTNKCTYLPNEDVIPKYSLLYCEYTVRNEIKQIKIDDKFLDIETQQKLFDSLFKTRKTIKEKTLLKWLKNDLKYPYVCEKATGFQKEDGFASSLVSYIDFTNIFGQVDAGNREMIEKLILWVTLFEDKKILRRKIKNEFPKINDAQIEKICKLNYSGWSSLSGKLLTGIKAPNKQGKMQSIMDALRDTRYNFMQLIASEKLPYKKLIEEEAKITNVEKITPDIVNSLAASPAVRRGILQTAAVVEEIVHIMGHAPKKIFIEFAREDADKKRTYSRKRLLEKKYENLKNSPEFAEIIKQLKATDEKSFDDRMLYLYYIQNGKSMYSGKKLNIERLSRECQIDHIVPQSYIKDDSFDNIVLVYSGENQVKTDKLLIDSSVQSNMKAFWSFLRRNELISQKKYDNLTRQTPFNSDDMVKFINRQLVETRQIIKHVANLFSSVYKDSEIVEIKAGLSHDIRMQYGLYKSREVNDFHHAHDALLAITVGRYVDICYPELKKEFNYNSFIKSFKKSDFAVSKKVSYGIVSGAFEQTRVEHSTGEVLWCGQEEVETLRKVFNYKDCFISKKAIELTGGFYKQTINPKANNDTLIPVKAGLDVAKYGGFIEPSQAYYAVIEFDDKNKRKKKLVGIPVQIAALSQNDDNAVAKYFANEGYSNAKILKDRILKYQKIEYDGHEYYLSSASEIINARQLIVDSNTYAIICKMNNPRQKSEVEDEDLIRVYNKLLEKTETYYTCFNSTYQKLLKGQAEFPAREKDEKIGIINQILTTLHANASNGNFKKYDFNGLTAREGRLNGKNLDVEKIVFINTSVTGMFSNKIFGKDL